MKLEINTKPTLTSYAHHAFICAIMERELNEEYLRFQVGVAGDEVWNEYQVDTKFEWKDNLLIIKGSKYATDTGSIIWRRCGETDELFICIEHFQCTNANAIVNLVISGENMDKCAEKNRNIYRLGIVLRYGLLIGLNDKYLEVQNVENNGINMTWFKVVRDNEKVTSYASFDGVDWIKVNEETLPEEMQGQRLSIGLNASLGENQYYNWLYMNYLQLYYSKDDSYVWLDYYMLPRKNYRFKHSLQFLDTCNLSVSKAIEVFGDIHRFFRWCIQHEYYVEIHLDEYYIENRPTYGKEHFEHNNIIYGFDDVTGKYSTIGYKVKVVFTDTSYSSIEKAISSSSKIILYKYNPNVKDMKFSLKNLTQNVRELLNGENSSEKVSNILGVQEGTYGLNVFDELIKSEEGNILLFYDCRITFLLYEHCNIMRNRLQFLFEKNYLNRHKCEKIVDLCASMLEKSDVLKNLVIKNKFRKNLDNAILENAKVLYEMEKTFYSKLLMCLEEAL